MDTVPFEEIGEEFRKRVERIVWAQTATVDRQGRPRMRVLHPVWEGRVGWITAAPGSLKLKHLAVNPWMSVGYWDQQQVTVTAECHATLVDDVAEKARVFALLKSFPEPYGFDASFYGGTPEEPGFALIRLDPWRIELAGYPENWEWQSQVWQAE